MTGQRKLETILMESGLASAEQLKQIASYAQAVGIDLYEAVLQKKIAPPDAVMMAYAESIGLPFIRFADVSVDEEIIEQIDPIAARQYSFVPIYIDQGHVLLAVTKPVIPDVEEELRMIFNMPVRCAICSPAELGEAIAKYFPRGTSQIIKAERAKMSQSQQTTQERGGVSPAVKPMDDEEKKNRFWLSVVAFNFSVAFVCFVLYYLRFPWYQLILLSIAVGGVVAFVVWKKLSR